MRSLLRDIPAVGWLITATIVVRTLVVALVIVGIGLLIDVPSPAHSAMLWWVLAGATAAAALLCAEAVLPNVFVHELNDPGGGSWLLKIWS